MISGSQWFSPRSVPCCSGRWFTLAMLPWPSAARYGWLSMAKWFTQPWSTNGLLCLQQHLRLAFCMSFQLIKFVIESSQAVRSLTAHWGGLVLFLAPCMMALLSVLGEVLQAATRRCSRLSLVNQMWCNALMSSYKGGDDDDDDMAGVDRWTLRF